MADEPTGNVAPAMAIQLIRLFEALNRLGTTVVVATHDVHLIRKVPESLIMRLDKGTLSDPTGALRYPPKRTVPGGRFACSGRPPSRVLWTADLRPSAANVRRTCCRAHDWAGRCHG